MRDIYTSLVGNVTKDPTPVQQKDGSTGAVVRVAVNSSYFDPTAGEYADRKTEFVTIFARRSLARHILTSVRKGDPILASGRMASAEWQREDGSAAFTMTLQAHSLGHDLTFGSTRFTKAAKRDNTPPVDPDSGELLPPAFSHQSEDGIPEASPGESSMEQGSLRAEDDSEPQHLVGAAAGESPAPF